MNVGASAHLGTYEVSAPSASVLRQAAGSDDRDGVVVDANQPHTLVSMPYGQGATPELTLPVVEIFSTDALGTETRYSGGLADAAGKVVVTIEYFYGGP